MRGRRLEFPRRLRPRGDDRAKEYFARIERQYAELAPRLGGLPSRPAILDIGCGLGGLTALLAQLLRARAVHLVDGTGAGEKRNKYTGEWTEPWCDVNDGVEFVRANVPARTEVIGHVATPGLCLDCTVGLVVSFRSWGHHYPAEVYADMVLRCLAPGGLVVLDLRRGHGGLEVLRRAGLAAVDVVPDKSGKCERTILRRRQGPNLDGPAGAPGRRS